MRFLNRGRRIEGETFIPAIISRLWDEQRGMRWEAFAVLLPIPIYRAGTDIFDPYRNNCYQGWFFPMWVWIDCAGDKTRHLYWHPWKVKKWFDRDVQRGLGV